jgi:hypothetical protein
VPRSVLLGRAVPPGERLWLDDDARLVLEYLRDEQLKCPGCGQYREDSMAKEADGSYRVREFRCHACAAKSQAAKKWNAKGAESGGLYMAVERVGDGD